MIQDIEPFHFHNEYHDVQPEAEDFIISMRDGQMLMGGDKSAIFFPTYALLCEQDREGRTFIYLFAIDKMRFFLCRDLELSGYTYRDPNKLRGGGPQHMVFAALVGMQLGRWYESHKFCGRCGEPMVPDTKERMLQCPSCGLMEYPKICPCVIVGVVHDGKILVIHYKNGFRDHYALIAGFAEIGETIEQTAAREVYEETHQHIKNLRFYKSQPWPISDSMLFGFFAELDHSGQIVIQEDELAMAKWVSPEEITEEWNNFALTNEMLCKFRDDYGKKKN